MRSARSLSKRSGPASHWASVTGTAWRRGRTCSSMRSRTSAWSSRTRPAPRQGRGMREPPSCGWAWRGRRWRRPPKTPGPLPRSRRSPGPPPSKRGGQGEAGAAPVRPQADAALREQVQQLLAGGTLPDPNPGAYGAALQRMARATPAGPPRSDHHATEPDRLVAMALEIGTMGPRLPAAVARVVAEGRLAQLLDALEGGAADTAAAATVRAQIATAAAVQRIVAREPVGFKLLERLRSLR